MYAQTFFYCGNTLCILANACTKPAKSIVQSRCTHRCQQQFSREAGKRFGVEYDVLDNHDGELLPHLQVRLEIIRKIRAWNADVVIAPRPNDYHPDHRYTGVLVQDAAYMVTVPNFCPEVPHLTKNPIFLYSSDRFDKPNPFSADIIVHLCQ